MKTIITNIVVIAILLASGQLALADNEGFPATGKVYDVIWAKYVQCANGQIKVISKGEGPWIFVEYTMLIPYKIPPPWPLVEPTSTPEEPFSVTNKLWINTQWIVTATEAKSGKESGRTSRIIQPQGAVLLTRIPVITTLTP